MWGSVGLRFATAAWLWGGVAAAQVAPSGPSIEMGPEARVVWRGGRAALVTGLAVETTGATPAERASSVLARWRDLFGPGLTPVDVSETKGRTTVRFVQRYGDVPVRGASVTVVLDAQSRVVRIVNDSEPLKRVEPATIDEAAARALATEKLPGTALKAHPVVLPVGDIGVAGYEVTVARVPMIEHKVVVIDAHAGRVIGVEDRVVR
jgi:hypothetical protein